MATTQQLLAEVNTNILGLLKAQRDEAMESYTTPDGRSYSRAQFAPLLTSLKQFRQDLRNELQEENRESRRNNRGPRPVRLSSTTRSG